MLNLSLYFLEHVPIVEGLLDVDTEGMVKLENQIRLKLGKIVVCIVCLNSSFFLDLLLNVSIWQ